jgi:hypothetical protein
MNYNELNINNMLNLLYTRIIYELFV